MFACFGNCCPSVRCTMTIIATRLETYFEGLPHVGIVIDDQNILLTHFGTYLVIGKLWKSIKRFPLSFRHTRGAFHSRKVVSRSDDLASVPGFVRYFPMPVRSLLLEVTIRCQPNSISPETDRENG